MRRSSKRCPRCLVHEDNCFCNELHQINIPTKLSVILFKKEKWLPSNTANTALMSLANSTKFERGHKDQFLQKDFIKPKGYYSLYLYPSDQAQELTADYLRAIDAPINLIVPDGTWRQAKKIHKREPLLETVPHVKIKNSPPSRYTLRRQKFEFGLCTFEAIAEAFRIIEGEEVYQLMQKNFDIFLEAHHTNRTIFEPVKNKGIHRNPDDT